MSKSKIDILHEHFEAGMLLPTWEEYDADLRSTDSVLHAAAIRKVEIKTQKEYDEFRADRWNFTHLRKTDLWNKAVDADQKLHLLHMRVCELTESFNTNMVYTIIQELPARVDDWVTAWHAAKGGKKEQSSCMPELVQTDMQDALANFETMYIRACRAAKFCAKRDLRNGELCPPFGDLMEAAILLVEAAERDKGK